MIKDKQILFIIGAYILVILLYATWALFISAFATAFPLYWIEIVICLLFRITAI